MSSVFSSTFGNSTRVFGDALSADVGYSLPLTALVVIVVGRCLKNCLFDQSGENQEPQSKDLTDISFRKIGSHPDPHLSGSSDTAKKVNGIVASNESTNSTAPSTNVTGNSEIQAKSGSATALKPEVTDENLPPFIKAIRTKPVLIYEIAKHMDIPILYRFSQLSSYIQNSKPIKGAWKELLENSLIGFRYDSAVGLIENFERFSSVLKRTIKERLSVYFALAPDDIRALFEKSRLSVHHVKKLLDYIMARDTLVVWDGLAKSAKLDSGPTSIHKSSEETIEKAKEFSAWFDENKEMLLENCESLDLTNWIQFLPEELSYLPNLSTLNFNNSKLTSFVIPEGGLNQLRSLLLGHNQLTSFQIPTNTLRGLTKLNLSHNRLRALPEEVFYLPNLFYLSLSNNELASFVIPEDSLNELDELNLSNNQLTEIGGSAGALQKLRSLLLDNNRLTTLNLSINLFRNLCWLSVLCNRLTTLEVPEGKPLKLTHLLLQGNSLTSFNDPTNELQELELLFLKDNQFTALPEGLFGRVGILDVSGNKLQALRISDGAFKKLAEIIISHDQPIEDPDQLESRGIRVCRK